MGLKFENFDFLRDCQCLVGHRNPGPQARAQKTALP
jgi:hypothetical protein